MKSSIFCLSLYFLAASGMLLLLTIFIPNVESMPNSKFGPFDWFHFTSMLFAIGVLLTKPTTRFKFLLPDIILLLLFGIVLYQYQTNSLFSSEQFLFVSQLIVLWFMLRATLQSQKEFRIFFIVCLLYTSLYPTLGKICHIDDAIPDNPTQKLVNGSLQPTLLLEYIAIVLPLCLDSLLHSLNCTKLSFKDPRTPFFYLSSLAVLNTIITLFSEINYFICFTALVSAFGVYNLRVISQRKTSDKIKHYYKAFFFSLIFLFSLFILYPSINLHNDQNEYVLINTHLGTPGLLLFSAWLITSIYYGIKHRQIGVAVSLLTFSILLTHSPLLQEPAYGILLLFLSTICITNPRKEESRLNSIPYIGILSAILSCFLFYGQFQFSF